MRKSLPPKDNKTRWTTKYLMVLFFSVMGCVSFSLPRRSDAERGRAAPCMKHMYYATKLLTAFHVPTARTVVQLLLAQALGWDLQSLEEGET